MPRPRRTPEARERIKNLRKIARQIVGRMDEHKLFAFILMFKGKKAIPHLVELWGEAPRPEKEEKSEEERVVPKEKLKPADELIELVTKKSKKG